MTDRDSEEIVDEQVFMDDGMYGRDTYPFTDRFSSKFSQIVLQEQATNFITMLHDAQLTVIP